MSEKIGGAKGTELDEDYVEMERVCICTTYFLSKHTTYYVHVHSLFSIAFIYGSALSKEVIPYSHNCITQVIHNVITL